MDSHSETSLQFSGKNIFKSDLEDLIDQYKKQSIRCFNLHELVRAKAMMQKTLNLSRKYDFPLDAGQQDLVEEFELE